MARRLAVLLIVVLAGTWLPAGAAEPCTDEEGRPQYERRPAWFRADEQLGNLGGLGLAEHVGWDDTAPTGSIRDGDGGRYAASRYGELAFSRNSARLGPTFEGTFDGCLDTIAVDLYLTGYPGQALTELVTGDAAYTIRPQLVVDDRAVFNAVPQGHRVTTDTLPGDLPLLRIRFAFTGIDAVLKALPHAFAPRDGRHRVRLTVVPHSISLDDAVFLYDTADAPAGMVFNAEDPGGAGYRLFKAMTRPNPQRPPDQDVCRPVLGDVPIGTAPCPGVRPGGLALIDGAGGCTLNFLFEGREKDGSVRRFAGTAGHCVFDGLAEQVWAPGEGPRVRTGAITGLLISPGEAYGHVAYARWDHLRDFALIELDPDVEANPQMCYWGGPTGVDHHLRPGPVTVRHFGQGLVYGDTVPARSGVAGDWRDPDIVFFHGAAISGDSGSGVITATGEAVGILSYLNTVENGDGYVAVVRLKPAVDDAIAALGLQSLRVLTAPLLG